MRSDVTVTSTFFIVAIKIEIRKWHLLTCPLYNINRCAQTVFGVLIRTTMSPLCALSWCLFP